MSLEAIPNLDDLTRDPMSATSLPAEIVENLLGKTAIVQSILISRLLALRAAHPDNTPSESDNQDRLLTVEEAARMIGKSESHLYHQAANYPFTVRIGGNLRCSRTGIEKFIRQRRGR
jgi:predicted DNA-binding transcriptional regulator AlpA